MDNVNKLLLVNNLFSVTYEDLRRMAASAIRRDPTATLNPTALVSEAWLKLSNSPQFKPSSRLEFKRVAAQAMRQVLVDAARRRHAQKRGGNSEEEYIALIANPPAPERTAPFTEDLLALDEALDELARFQPRQASLVESRFFGGLDLSETAELLQVSEATAKRDWRLARAWLKYKLRRKG